MKSMDDQKRSSGNKSNYKSVNVDYYHEPHPGRMDYWRLMAAPRFRMKTILEIISGYNSANLIDLGCGNGELLREVQKRYPRLKLCGVDLSETQININKQRNPSVAWHAIDLDKDDILPEQMFGSFDTIIASEIIEHVDNPTLFLKNACALAKPKIGRLILSTQSGKIWETERRVGHRNHFLKKEMKLLLEKGGWKPVEVRNAGFPFHNLAKFFANLKPSSTMKGFSDRPYGVFQKTICFILRMLYKLNSHSAGSQLFVVARRES